MIDPVLERRAADCKELLQLWNTFHKYFAIAVKGEDLITHEREAEFLHLKSRIAMLHDSFMAALKHDQDIGQYVLSVIERSITLKHINRLSVAEINKMQIEWHESYLLLSEIVASLEEQMETISKINPTTYKLNKIKGNVIANVKAFFTSTYFKVILVILGIPIALILLNQVWAFSNLKNYRITRGAYYSCAKIWRIVNPNMPYERFEDIRRTESARPSDLKTDKPLFEKSTAANLVVQPDLKMFLMGSNVQFKEEAYTFEKSSDRLFILMFMVTSEDGSEKAEEFMNNFTKWKNSPSNQDRIFFETYNDVFRVNNVIIIIHSPRKADRKTIKEMEFGVSD